MGQILRVVTVSDWLVKACCVAIEMDWGKIYLGQQDPPAGCGPEGLRIS